jgi:hypothetical protein
VDIGGVGYRSCMKGMGFITKLHGHHVSILVIAKNLWDYKIKFKDIGRIYELLEAYGT